MDEKKFFEYMDIKHAEIIEGIAKILEMVGIKLTTIKFADHSKKEPRESSGKGSVEYNGETYIYSKEKKCKYCDEHYTGWKQPYEQGDRPISIDYDGNVIEGGCPRFN